MTINLNNSATEKIPPSGKICPLVQWILISIVFILFALFEYFVILVVLRFWDKVTHSVNLPQALPLRWVARQKLGRLVTTTS